MKTRNKAPVGTSQGNFKDFWAFNVVYTGRKEKYQSTKVWLNMQKVHSKDMQVIAKTSNAKGLLYNMIIKSDERKQ